MKNSTTDRLACVDLPAFPLQLLLKRRPEWASQPAAVVAEDKPQGVILWVNDRARQLGVLPGMRYSAAFSLATALRAGEVAAGEIKQAVEDLTQRLMRWSPEVEPARQEPGVFWLNGAGLKPLFPTANGWAKAIDGGICANAYEATVVIGYSRFGTYAIAKSRKGITVFRSADQERAAARQVALDCLHIDAKFRDVLLKLGVRTIGDLLALPPGGLRERFGVDAHRLYRMAAGDLWAPLQASAPAAPVVERRILDDAESDATRLLFMIKQMLHPLLATLATRAQALTILWLSLLIDHGDWLKEQLRPAEPTLNAIQILDLVRLRLESIQLTAGVIEVELRAESCVATREQLRLFIEGPKRNIDAANRALARLRAEFGDSAVVQARLRDGHLPEANFTWEPLDRVKLPTDNLNGARRLSPSTGLRAGGLNGPPVLVRRIIAKPIMLAGSPHRTHEDGWLLLGPHYGSVEKLTGPYVFSGGWWKRELQREYYYAETRRGEFLWVYYDRTKRRWFLQGAIE